MKIITDTFLRAFATGIAIAIGGIAYLSCENRYLGAFLFGTGLFVILSFGFNLFTGKVGYAVENKPSYILNLIVIWLGNLAGTALSAFLVLNTRICCIADKASAMCDTKLTDSPLSIFILAVFCGLLMFIAADGYKTITNNVGKILAVFLPVVVFILSGFEHCVANMFYFTLAQVWSGKAILWLMIMTLGNSAGGILIPILRKGFIKNEAL
ncbi:MAG: formate/nitrite transporter family protein [Ruminococcus sp.]|uniref:formate/nitrite transporter family protein n=1 Tax=Ruminococcus sp. TaxID=41978 RepID=UPI0025E53677|nr:formate/nitrite transporter family protein [Ruminococcus sp.]MBR6996418.1 formate/nitrite transporter family protein [Ruminococcus sp.]